MSEVVRVLNWTPGCFVEMPPYSSNPTYITETLMIGYMSRELLKGVVSKKIRQGKRTGAKSVLLCPRGM